MTKQEALKLLEISANLTAEALHAGVVTQDEDGQLTEAELEDLFSACVDMVHEKFEKLHVIEEDVKDLDEKFASISEMHKVFAQKFAEYDQKLGRPSRRPL